MRQTNTIVLTAEDQPRIDPPWSRLVSFSGAQGPRALRLEVRALVPGKSDEEARQYALAIGSCGVWWNWEVDPHTERMAPAPWLGGAALRIAYGSAPGISRTIYADLRSGEFSIPTCEAIDVSAAFWATSEFPSIQRVEVAAEISDGYLADTSPLWVTATRIAETATVRCAVPPGAYAWDVTEANGLALSAHCGPNHARRVHGGTWTPPTQPLLINGPSSHTIEVTAPTVTAGAQWEPTITYWIR